MQLRHICISAIATVAMSTALFSSCKKKDEDGNVSVSFQKLGDQRVNILHGSAMNGDILGRAENGGIIRYREATHTWERVGTVVGLTFPNLLVPACEDAAGNFYARLPGGAIYTTTGGLADWVKFVSPDSDPLSANAPANSAPFANAAGDLVLQTHTTKDNVQHMRIYRKPAGSASWTMVSERTGDYYDIISFDDNGTVYFVAPGNPDLSPMVLRAGSNTLEQTADCNGVTLLPYCGSDILVNAKGGSIWYKGGLASHNLYRMPPTTSFPATAALAYEMPEGMCCFNGGQAYLPDGTLVARMNNGTYDDYHLFVHRANASGWTDAGLLPSEDGLHSVDIVASRNGGLFTWSIGLGAVQSVGPVYKINY